MNPLSSLYGITTAGRNNLYDRGILKSYKLSRPVVSVGNISVGGSGKTPFVIMLGELFKQRGIEFDVLSRGYGRKTRGPMLVDPNGTSHDFGDEPLLIARRLSCPVIVGESRSQAGKLAEKEDEKDHVGTAAGHVGTAALGCPTSDHVVTAAQASPEQSRRSCPPGQRPGALHLLDDGFQHRSLARNFDIVLLTQQDLHDQLLPTGRLREPLSSLRRADAVVLTEEIDPAHLPAVKNIWSVRRNLTITGTPKNPIAFCGIARPQRFVEQLRNASIQPVAEKFYRDHHQYTPSDIRDLLRLKKENRADVFITTEKDAINLGQYLAELDPMIARVEMELVNAADALDTMFRVIGERKAKA
jgi:tetraacyldisaccharide 4'-kinase